MKVNGLENPPPSPRRNSVRNQCQKFAKLIISAKNLSKSAQGLLSLTVHFRVTRLIFNFPMDRFAQYSK